jgi:hypothetical protein
LGVLGKDNCVPFGEGVADKGLGVVVGTPEQVDEQWAKEHASVRAECARKMEQLGGMCTSSKVNLIKGMYAARLPYRAAVQVSRKADEELGHTQRVFDTALFGEGGHCFASRQTSYQPRWDGGVGHIHVASRMRAEWAHLAAQLGTSEEMWAAVWRDELEGVYGIT